MGVRGGPLQVDVVLVIRNKPRILGRNIYMNIDRKTDIYSSRSLFYCL